MSRLVLSPHQRKERRESLYGGKLWGSTMSACAFCGHPDSRHRIIEAIQERMTAGEPQKDVLHDYGLSAAQYVGISREVAEAEVFRCPCMDCDRCGWDADPEDFGGHPEDGIAYCPRCHHSWWAHVGREPGRCARSLAEVGEMKAYDDQIMAAN